MKRRWLLALAVLEVVWKVLRRPSYVILAVIIATAMLGLTIWLVNIPLLSFVSGSNTLSFGEKAAFFLSGYTNYFKNLDSPLAYSGLILALLIGLNGALLAYVLKRRSLTGKDSGKTGLAAVVAVIGSGCAACGTGILGPFIGSVVASGAYLSGDRVAIATIFGTAINIIGMMLILYSIYGLARVASFALVAERQA